MCPSKVLIGSKSGRRGDYYGADVQLNGMLQIKQVILLWLNKVKLDKG